MKYFNYLTSLFCLVIILTFSACQLFDELDDETNLRNYEDFVKEQDKYPAWSRDGEWIAYYHYSAQFTEPADYPSGLYIIDKDGINRQLVLEGTGIESPSWSPDGDSLVFSNRGLIQKCAIDGSGLTALVSPESISDPVFYFPNWSADGSKIIFDKAIFPESGIYSVNAYFSNVVAVFFYEIQGGRDPELSHSGQEILYMRSFTSQPFQIFISNSGDIRQLTDDNRDNRYPTWSPDDQKIAWSANVQIHTMNADGSNVKAHDIGNYPSWSINDKIVYSGPNSDITKEVLFIINADGSNKIQITF